MQKTKSVKPTAPNFFKAVSRGDVDEGERMVRLKGELVRSRSFYGKTALHIAVAQTNAPMCKILLLYGSDPNAQFKPERTALGLATISACQPVLKLLLRFGANGHQLSTFPLDDGHVTLTSPFQRAMSEKILLSPILVVEGCPDYLLSEEEVYHARFQIYFAESLVQRIFPLLQK